MKLGEALVKEGLITREQLRRALERQVIFGGRIGTNIVELGILKEEELTRFLSKYFKVPYVSPSELQAVDEEVIAALSVELAEKYKVVPFKKEKNRLHVAMLETKNIQVLDELRFVSGYDIIPYISTELRILFALEKYYNIKRDIRFVSLIDKEEEVAPPQAVYSAPQAEATARKPEEPLAQPAPEPPQEPPKAEPVYEDPLMRSKNAFASVNDRDEVASILVTEAGRIAKRVAVFMAKGTEIIGWKSSGIDASSFKTVALAPSVFYEVLERKHYYRGPVLAIPANNALIGLLGGTPEDSLLVPIMIKDRVIAILYADNGNSEVLDANLAFVNTLCRLSALSFELLIVKKKILEL